MRIHRSLIFLALPLLAALPAWSQKTHIDFDGATAFSEYTTFQFRETRQDLRGVSSSLHRRVVDQIVGFATDGGLTPDLEEPDVYIAYYAAYWGDVELVLGDLEYTYGPGFELGSYWEGGGGSSDFTSQSFVFKEGTVVVAVWDRERQSLVWRGMATAALEGDDEKREARLDKALKRLMKRWEKMCGGGTTGAAR